MATRIGVYPGTFDPITLGHADIIQRGAKLVDRLIIGVTTNISKDPLFTPAERIAMVTREVAALALGNVGGHPDDQPVNQLGPALDDIGVAQCDRIEGAGINPDAGGT